MYNWMYPLQNRTPFTRPAGAKGHRLFGLTGRQAINSRALYFHIPFCDTICSFCPFVRGPYSGAEVIERYVQALIREIEIKARYPGVRSVPIGAIFVGGGTPSLLSPDQIRRFGASLHRHFDLSGLAEFSFECEAKSVTPESARALREIGVTHGRFGVQTFDPGYRELFTLTATVGQVQRTADVLREHLPFVSFDLLYGMNGQTIEHLARDLDRGVALGPDNIDLYPIDNVVTQRRLHRDFAARGLPPTAAKAKLEMKLFATEYLRAAGFAPHNGHGYVRVPGAELDSAAVVSDAYCFQYHDHIYGYADRDLIGFGAGAVSLLDGLSITNTEYRAQYTEAVLREGDWELTVSPQHPSAQNSRGVVMRLPYHGSLEKSRIDWSRVYPETLRSLGNAIRHRLVVDTGAELALTQVGWYWYVELMYYLMPRREQAVLDSFIEERAEEPGRQLENTRLVGPEAADVAVV